MTHAPIIEEVKRRRKVGKIIGGVLADHGMHVPIEEQALNVHRDYISESTNSRVLSDAILNKMFPRIQEPIELFHYTNAGGLAGIACSHELRLFPIRHHIEEGEIDTFAKKHGLHGYLHSDQGEPYFKELSDDLFYTSFTDPAAKNELHMWNAFGRAESGARLRFRLAPKMAELRVVQYDASSRTLLEDLNERLLAANEAIFVPWAVSKIGAFYLPSTLLVESEMRLLVKRHEHATIPTKTDHDSEYLPIPIATPNEYCHVDVVDVAFGRKADKSKLRASLKGTPLQDVTVTAP